MLKAVSDSLFTCFASHLDPQLQDYVQLLIGGLFQAQTATAISAECDSDKYVLVEGFVIDKGKHKPQLVDERDFVTTNSFRKLLRQLASVVAVTDYAVILQGPTSAGKTSTV